LKEILIGIISALFFAFTFILNHAMELDGGSWLWSASLRYFFMLPFLIIIVLWRKGSTPLFIEMKRNPTQWFVWSFVGFVLFYAPLTFAAAFGPGWLVSGTWQFTIVAGVLLAPLFLTATGIRLTIPRTSLLISCFILLGIILIQIPQASSSSWETILLGSLPVLVAAFAYPLGNRKMMELVDNRIDTFQRILGMTIMSMPAWILMAIIALSTVGLPSTSQVINSFFVAVTSGIIATTLFFIATERSRNHQGKLAAVEATQSTEVLFVIIGEMLLLQLAAPPLLAVIGIIIITVGMILHSYHTTVLGKKAHNNKKAAQSL
jgi:drug/metabolite transporter (DMT)-like permease